MNRSLLLSLLAPLATLLIAAAPAQAASAPGSLALETAVGRSTPLTSALVRPDPLRTVITPRAATHLYDRIAVATGHAAESAAWTLPRAGGARIGGRWFTEHALERMAPRAPEVMADLERRALARAEAAGLKPGTPEFARWWRSYGPDPRGIPPSVVEAEVANPGSTGVRVVTNANGDVVTVIPGGG